MAHDGTAQRPGESSRVGQIRERLVGALHPDALEVHDDSAAHAGHGGFDPQGSHFRVKITAPCFAGLERLARHRLVYDALAPMMHRDIHALVLDLRAPGE